MAETPTKIHYPTNADTFDPAGDMEQIANTVHHIVPVANVTERNALADAYNPTPERPLYVDRADTGNLERNSGDGWATYFGGDTGWQTVDAESGWGSGNIYARMKGGWVMMWFSLQRGSVQSGDWRNLCWIPDGMHHGVQYTSQGLASAEGGTPFYVRIHEGGRLQVSFSATVSSSNHILRGDLQWPV